MGASSSSSNATSDGKFIKIGEEYIGEEEKTFSSVNIYQIRFLQSKVIDRIIVQLRIEVKVGSLLWTILRTLEDFRQLKVALKLPPEFGVPFPKTDHRSFPDNQEIVTIQADLSKWLVAAAGVGIKQSPMITFLGVMDTEISETAARKIDLCSLVRTCETGDILLFKTQGFIPSSIRKITSAKFDHIGVVIVKFPEGGGREVCFLEASGDSYGVNLHDLKKRLHEWFLADAMVCYRRLRCVRNERFRMRTDKFITMVKGLKYGWSIKTMVLNTRDQHASSKSKFFCSELVTALYKHLGFIQSFAKSHNYMPGDFAEKEAGSRLNLVDAILENEIIVTKWPRRTRVRMAGISEGKPRKRSHSQGNCLAHNCLRGPAIEKGSRKHRRKRSQSLTHLGSIRGRTDEIVSEKDESSIRRSSEDDIFPRASDEIKIDM